MCPGLLASTLCGHDRTAAGCGSQSCLLLGLRVWGGRAIPMLSIYTWNSHQLYILPFGICHMQWGLSKSYQINEQFMNITFNLGCVTLNNSIAYPIAKHRLYQAYCAELFNPSFSCKVKSRKWFYKWVYIERSSSSEPQGGHHYSFIFKNKGVMSIATVDLVAGLYSISKLLPIQTSPLYYRMKCCLLSQL